MKKIQLSIPKPCHENWNTMTPEDKGRFCGSCQKTVVDFSTISDRQVAEFFKKPAGSVCGRFHADQLDREIVIPRKRIPWVRYFFTIAIPAFLMSCKFGGRQATKGIITLKEQRSTTDSMPPSIPPPPPVVGMIMPEIFSVDSTQCKQKTEQTIEPMVMGKIAPPPIMGDTIIIPVPKPILMGKIMMPVDTITKPLPSKTPVSQKKNRCKIEAIEGDSTGFGKVPFVFRPVLPQVKETSSVSEEQFIVVGGVWATGISPKKKKPVAKAVTTKEKQPMVSSFLIYPNPATSNADITVKPISAPEGFYRVSLIDANGAVVQQLSEIITGKAPASFLLKQLPAGSYFLQLTNTKTGKGYSETILIQ